MKITASALTGRSAALEVEATATLDELRGAIRAALGVQVAEQRLSVAGQQLEGSRPLAEYGIVEGAMVDVAFGTFTEVLCIPGHEEARYTQAVASPALLRSEAAVLPPRSVVAWSSFGLIAYASVTGSNAGTSSKHYVTFLDPEHPNDRAREETPHKDQICALAWTKGPVTPYLASADEAGIVAIWAMKPRLKCINRWEVIQSFNFKAAVCLCSWLDSGREYARIPSAVPSTAVRKGLEERFHPVEYIGPTAVAGRPYLVAVTMTGEIHVCHPTGVPRELTFFSNPLGRNIRIVHADVCSSNQHLVFAVSSRSNTVRMYAVSLNATGTAIKDSLYRSTFYPPLLPEELPTGPPACPPLFHASHILFQPEPNGAILLVVLQSEDEGAAQPWQLERWMFTYIQDTQPEGQQRHTTWIRTNVRAYSNEHGRMITAATCSSDRRLFFIGFDNGTMLTLAVGTLEKLFVWTPPPPTGIPRADEEPNAKRRRAAPSPVMSIAVSPNGCCVAIASLDGAVSIVELSRWVMDASSDARSTDLSRKFADLLELASVRGTDPWDITAALASAVRVVREYEEEEARPDVVSSVVRAMCEDVKHFDRHSTLKGTAVGTRLPALRLAALRASEGTERRQVDARTELEMRSVLDAFISFSWDTSGVDDIAASCARGGSPLVEPGSQYEVAVPFPQQGVPVGSSSRGGLAMAPYILWTTTVAALFLRGLMHWLKELSEAGAMASEELAQLQDHIPFVPWAFGEAVLVLLRRCLAHAYIAAHVCGDGEDVFAKVAAIRILFAGVSLVHLATSTVVIEDEPSQPKPIDAVLPGLEAVPDLPDLLAKCGSSHTLHNLGVLPSDHGVLAQNAVPLDANEAFIPRVPGPLPRACEASRQYTRPRDKCAERVCVRCGCISPLPPAATSCGNDDYPTAACLGDMFAGRWAYACVCGGRWILPDHHDAKDE